jgi:hypothetical protein
MKDLIVQSKKAFFDKKLLKEYDQQKHDYDPAVELAKSRKSRSRRVASIVSLFIFVLAFVAFIVTLVIEGYATNVTIDIKDFQNVAFNDILDTLTRYERELNDATQKLNDTKAERDAKIQARQEKTSQQIELVGISLASDDEKSRRIDSLRAQERVEIERVLSSYSPKIEEAEKELQKAKTQIEQYDNRQIEEVRKREKFMNSQREVFDAEMKAKVDYYENRIRELESEHSGEVGSLKDYQTDLRKLLEDNYNRKLEETILKYNPIFQTDELSRIINDMEDQEVPPLLLTSYTPLLIKYGLMSAKEDQALRKLMSELSLVIQTLRDINYKNSIPASLKLIDYARSVLINKYEQLMETMAKGMDRYYYAFESLAQANSNEGYVLDARDIQNMGLFIRGDLNVATGNIAMIEKPDSTRVARISLTVNGKEVSGKTIQVLSNRPIEPFDRVVVSP